MLRALTEIIGYTLQAKDGEIGSCDDFLFDDENWTIRYMVANTHDWIPGRKVLISPISLGEPDWTSRCFPVLLNKEQIKGSPHLEEDAPVSKQHEIQLAAYYEWPAYWSRATLPDPVIPNPISQPKTGESHQSSTAAVKERVLQARKDKGDPHLRSAMEVKGYHIEALDDKIGHVEDFILDDKSWIIRYMIVDTRNWFPGGKKILVSPGWINSVDWKNTKVEVDLTKETIKEGPEYDPGKPVNREYEERLYDFHGRPYYWI